jgi:hypothetical protein
MIDIAEHIERMGDSLASFVESTAPELLAPRHPTAQGEARSVLELVEECITTNLYVAALLGLRPGDMLDRSQFTAAISDAAEARAQLVESCKALSERVRALSPEAYEQAYPHWRGALAGKELVMGAYRNMAYHVGQINYIQILAGDNEFHRPSSWYYTAQSS